MFCFHHLFHHFHTLELFFLYYRDIELFNLLLDDEILSWPRSHDSQSRDLGVTRSRYHETSLAKRPRASPRFRISDMKISPETFSPVYKIILHLTLLLAEQHELMTFKSVPNVIHKTGGK